MTTIDQPPAPTQPVPESEVRADLKLMPWLGVMMFLPAAALKHHPLKRVRTFDTRRAIYQTQMPETWQRLKRTLYKRLGIMAAAGFAIGAVPVLIIVAVAVSALNQTVVAPTDPAGTVSSAGPVITAPSNPDAAAPNTAPTLDPSPSRYNGLPPMEPGETYNTWMDRVGDLLPPELTTPYVYQLGSLDDNGLPVNTYVRPVAGPRSAVEGEPGSTSFGVPFAPAVGEIPATTYDTDGQVFVPHNYLTPIAGEALDDPSLVPYDPGSKNLDEISAAKVFLSLLKVGHLAVCSSDGTDRQDLSYLPYAYGASSNFSDEYTLWFMSDVFGGQGCNTSVATEARAVQVSPNEFYVATNIRTDDSGQTTAYIDRLVRFNNGWRISYGGGFRY